MKQKLLVKLLLPSILLILFVATNYHNTSRPELSIPATNAHSHSRRSKTKTNTANRPVKINTKVAKPPSKTVQPSKHESVLLKQNPSAQNFAYYPLQSVNDPNLGSSWAMTKVQANRAWDLSTSSNQVIVAVIDTGFSLNHEELTNKWHINTAETGTTSNGDTCWTDTPANKDTNNCDDDNNGYIDDWRGFDFYNNDNRPIAGEVNPNGTGTSHATLVSGVIAATANNQKGAAGIAYNAEIMPLQIFSDNSMGYTTDVVAAIEYATNNGAKIINLSLGGSDYDPLLLSAIQFAQSHGVFVVAASGNCALNDQQLCNSLTAPGRMTYPGLYPEVFTVGATTSGDVRADFSSYGSQLDIVAPGSSVGPLPTYSPTGQTSMYASASGTSFSTPMVAGVAALLISQNPGISISQISSILTSSTDILPAMGGQSFTQEYGYGVVNAHKATLLGLAKTQNNLLGARELSPREPAIGNIWRSVGGNVGSDEYILLGCRVSLADKCSASVQNGSIYRFYPVYGDKSDSLQYMFIKGSSVPSGSWNISVNSHEYAKSVGTLTR